MQIRPLDAADPAAMADWHAAYHAAHVFGQDYPSPWMLEEMRAEFLGDRTGERMEPYGVYVDGRLRRHRVRRAAADGQPAHRPRRGGHPPRPPGPRLRLGAAGAPHRGRGRAGPQHAERRRGLAPRRPPGRRGHTERRLPDPARVRVLPRRRQAGAGPARRRRAARAAGRRGGDPPRRATAAATSSGRCPRTSSTRSAS